VLEDLYWCWYLPEHLSLPVAVVVAVAELAVINSMLFFVGVLSAIQVFVDQLNAIQPVVAVTLHVVNVNGRPVVMKSDFGTVNREKFYFLLF